MAIPADDERTLALAWAGWPENFLEEVVPDQTLKEQVEIDQARAFQTELTARANA